MENIVRHLDSKKKYISKSIAVGRGWHMFKQVVLCTSIWLQMKSVVDRKMHPFLLINYTLKMFADECSGKVNFLLENLLPSACSKCFWRTWMQISFCTLECPPGCKDNIDKMWDIELQNLWKLFIVLEKKVLYSTRSLIYYKKLHRYRKYTTYRLLRNGYEK